jgi:hypothetical protein
MFIRTGRAHLSCFRISLSHMYAWIAYWTVAWFANWISQSCERVSFDTDVCHVTAFTGNRQIDESISIFLLGTSILCIIRGAVKLIYTF